MKLSWTLMKNLKLRKRNFAQNQYKESWKFALKKLAFNSMKFNRYELYMDDMLYYDNLINYYYTSLIHKALRRLPEEVLVARNFS